MMNSRIFNHPTKIPNPSSGMQPRNLFTLQHISVKLLPVSFWIYFNNHFRESNKISKYEKGQETTSFKTFYVSTNYESCFPTTFPVDFLPGDLLLAWIVFFFNLFELEICVLWLVIAFANYSLKDVFTICHCFWCFSFTSPNERIKTFCVLNASRFKISRHKHFINLKHSAHVSLPESVNACLKHRRSSQALSFDCR